MTGKRHTAILSHRGCLRNIGERWTPLVIRELLCGSVRFNDLQRGVPRMSSSLLARRLKEFQFAGIVERRRRKGGGFEYHLTRPAENYFNDVIRSSAKPAK